MDNQLVKGVTSFEEVIQSTYNHKLTKIEESPNKKKIVTLEYQYIEYYFNRNIPVDDLLRIDEDEGEIPEDKPAYNLIQIVAHKYYNQNKHNSRIALEDFLSACYEKAWKVINSYDYQSNYWLYHHLSKYLKQACIDVLRKEGLTNDRYNHTNKLFHNAVPFVSEVVDAFSIEDSIILNYNLQNTVKTLNDNELKVYNLFLNADNVEEITLKDICLELNLKHRQQAKRILDNLRSKLKNVL